jgi:hypothetical protein
MAVKLGKKKRIRKPAPPKPVLPSPDLGVVRDLFARLKAEIDIDDKCDSRLFGQIEEAERDFFRPSVRKKLQEFKQEIAANLRATAKTSRPDLDHKVGFYVWVAENVPNSMERLKLIDEIEECPDSFRADIKEHFMKTSYKYGS